MQSRPDVNPEQKTHCLFVARKSDRDIAGCRLFRNKLLRGMGINTHLGTYWE